MRKEREISIYRIVVGLGIIAILLASCAPGLQRDPVYAQPIQIKTSVASVIEVDCKQVAERQITESDFQNGKFVLLIGNPGGGPIFPNNPAGVQGSVNVNIWECETTRTDGQPVDLSDPMQEGAAHGMALVDVGQ